MNQIVKVEEIVFDKELYPRFHESWQTIIDYTESVKVGVKFPPIVLGKYKGKKYLIDGFHRLKAVKNNKIDFIEAEIMEFEDKKSMYIESVKRNAVHGKPFTFQEKMNIVLELEKFNVDKGTITSIIGISSQKLEKFKVSSVSYGPSGEKVILKKPVRNMAGMTLTQDQIDLQDSMEGRTQPRMIEGLIQLMKKDMIDTSNKTVNNKLRTLYNELKKIFEE